MDPSGSTEGVISASDGTVGKKTLADRLLESKMKATHAVQHEDYKDKSGEELSEILEEKIGTERDLVDRIGRRLNTMLVAVEHANNVAKLVQTLLADAIDVFKQAITARAEAQHVVVLVNKAAGAVASGTHMTLEESVLAEIRSINSKLTDQGEQISAMAATIKSGQGEAGQWAEVVKRKAYQKKAGAKLVPPLAGGDLGLPTRTNPSARTTRTRPPAILVRVKDVSYSEVLKMIKGSGEVQAVSDYIVGLSKTRDGDLLIRLKAKNQTSGKIVDAISTAMGDKAAAREMAHFQKVVVQDLDEQAEPSEIVEAICGATNAKSEEVRVISTRYLSRGQKWVVISLPAHIANKALAAGKLRVGYVNCRIRSWEYRGRGRCPKCLAFGHRWDDCSGPDRGDRCRECGLTGHQAASCNSTEDVRVVFKAVLSGNTGGKRND
ncbi:unnamed protein product [Macrosiphum euphorbiae]|uniref:CCHC-type domain-containing protein n=1 Tax=Macrosiphum euphorbiae TaxID=13131 RepID=A0AAV0Y6L0_9HEMI|nr:unnamed protein product [Macrosiphum euphorbiae]